MPPSPSASAIWLRSLRVGDQVYVPERDEHAVVAREPLSFRKKPIVLLKRPFQKRLVHVSEVDDDYVDVDWSVKSPIRQAHLFKGWVISKPQAPPSELPAAPQAPPQSE